MFRTTMMICVLATTLAVSVNSCYAQAPRVIAQKLYDQLDQALANHDLNRELGFYDSSYVETDVQGKHMAFAEWRRQEEQYFPLFRNINPSTTVEDVQLEAGRMVVYVKSEWHFEYHDQRYGWVPKIFNGTAEDTWERKGGQWKLVQTHNLRAKMQVDPKWLELQKQSLDDARAIINCSGGCPPPK
jgi:hypothetical protein